MSRNHAASFSMSDALTPVSWSKGCIYASGDCCIILEFSSELSLEANRQAAKGAAILAYAKRQGRLTGVLDVVPAMVTIGIHYQPESIPCDGGDSSPYRVLCQRVILLLEEGFSTSKQAARQIEIPICYGGEYGPDLAEVADYCGISTKTLIERHTAQWLDVLMLGFAPGHAYIGLLDDTLAPPRRTIPRTRVAQGSIGLANRQTVVYPMDLPGGWNIIGRTPLLMFVAANESPCLLRNGDRVRFVAIDESTFHAMARRSWQ